MFKTIFLLPVLVYICSACGFGEVAKPVTLPSTRVMAVETFLADIAQHVAGDRLKVDVLLQPDVDPHSYQPTPRDVTRIAESTILIINGAGLESFLGPLLVNAGGERLVIEASDGLKPRSDPGGDHPMGDPHFWLDPINVIKYVENIRDGLSQSDPGGTQTYTANAKAYIEDLHTLDAWIKEQVSQIPPAHRLLVTDHETFGYFAERYGFTVVGTVIPGLSSEASPSAQQMTSLIKQIKQMGAPAIFLEAGANPILAEQIANETGTKVITNLYTHSISSTYGPAPTYIDMMKYNVKLIVEALK